MRNILVIVVTIMMVGGVILEVINWIAEFSLPNHYSINFREFKTVYNEEYVELHFGGICVNEPGISEWHYFYFSPWQHLFLYLPFCIRENQRIKKTETEKILAAIQGLDKDKED